MNRIERILAALQETLHPLNVALEDESLLHAGHAGATTGRGHFQLRIVSNHFEGQTLIARHRLVYAALGDLMQTEIHALSIRALTPGEAARHSQQA